MFRKKKKKKKTSITESYMLNCQFKIHSYSTVHHSKRNLIIQLHIQKNILYLNYTLITQIQFIFLFK
jgi:hypothetical protein